MIGVILAAGKGSRLGSLTEDTPKSLLPLNPEKTLLDYNLAILQSLKVDRIVIVTGFSSEKIENHVADLDNVKCVFNPFREKCNVLGSLYICLPYLDDDFLFLHADTLVGLDAWEQLSQAEGDLVLPYQKKICGEEEMKVRHSESGNLISITKEMDGAEADGEFLGIAKFSSELLPYFTETAKRIFRERGLNEYMESLIQVAINENKKVETFDIGVTTFVEVDFEQDYQVARQLFG